MIILLVMIQVFYCTHTHEYTNIPSCRGKLVFDSSRLLERIFVYTLVKLYNKIPFGQSHDVARHLTRIGLFYLFSYFHSCTVKRLSIYLSLEIEVNHLINALSSKSFHYLLTLSLLVATLFVC